MPLTLRERAPAVLARVPSSVLQAAATTAGFLVLLVGVLAMHGFLPGLSQPMVQTIVDAGDIQCLHNAGWHALTARCDTVGLPTGLRFVLGVPETMLGWAISWLPGVDAWAAHQILNAALDALALAGGYLLLRRWTVPRPIALIAPAVYLVTPSLLGVNGFGYTFNGYTFLPLYLYLFLCGIDRYAEGHNRWIGAGYLTGLTFLMVFTDGYSYATALLFIGFILIWWLIRDPTSRRAKALALATFITANILAVAAYSAYLDSSSSPTVGIGAFRLLGLDPVTLFVPQRGLIWPHYLGYHPGRWHLWGDGSNSIYNYMGYVMLAIVAGLLISRRLRRQPTSQQRELVPLLLASVIALILSFGPALKFNSQSVPVSPSYNVPVSKTVIELPTTFLYQHVPPFDSMRATFRWSIGFRFILVFAAAYALALLWKSGRRGIAALLLVIASVEVLPTPGAVLSAHRSAAKGVASVRADVVREFDDLTVPGERILLLPASNDFLALAMVPAARVSSYNTAGDKSYVATRARWPSAVQAAVRGIRVPTGQGNRIAGVLRHDADAVAICYFSMHAGGTHWPAPDPQQALLHQEVAQLAADPRFTVQQGSQMALIRLRG